MNRRHFLKSLGIVVSAVTTGVGVGPVKQGCRTVYHHYVPYAKDPLSCLAHEYMMRISQYHFWGRFVDRDKKRIFKNYDPSKDFGELL